MRRRPIVSIGAFIILYGFISVKIKNAWYLGEACKLPDTLSKYRTTANAGESPPVPAVIIGIALGPIAAKFIDSERWGSAMQGQQSDITLVCTL